MKKLNKKQIAFLSISLFCFMFLIYMLICPLGFLSGHYYCYSSYYHRVIGVITNSPCDSYYIDTPFTVLKQLNIPQIIVFCLMAISFIVFIILFVLEIKRDSRHSTKAERMQTQIDELQKQVDELKKGE